MDFVEKYRGQGGRRSVYDILSLDPKTESGWNAIKENYVATDIHKVKIGGNTFTNYGDFQFAWEKSYVESPERSADGTIGNLNSHATFATPHLILNFSLMSIDDYRKIMRLDLEQNEFVVECYDPIYNRPFKGKMYFAPLQMAKLFKIAKIRFDGEQWEEFVELVGVQEYTVELIGTNADLDLLSVRYHLNPPSDTGVANYSIADNEIYSGEEIIMGAGADEITSETFGGKYKFTQWNVSPENPTTLKNSGNYLNGYAYTINKGDEIDVEGQTAFHLYAQWASTSTHTLTFNYGLADPAINGMTQQYETSRKVAYNQSIGYLPVVDTPFVEIKEGDITKKYYPYYNGGWYKTPIKAKNSQKLLDNSPYWLHTDASIYLLYDTHYYTLNLYLDGKMVASNSIPYNSPMNLPSFVKSGYTFDGWYSDPSFADGTKVENGNMPPYGLTLYARWV